MADTIFPDIAYRQAGKDSNSASDVNALIDRTEHNHERVAELDDGLVGANIRIDDCNQRIDDLGSGNYSSIDFDNDFQNKSLDDLKDGSIHTRITIPEKQSYDNHITDTGNPHYISKDTVELSQVDNIKQIPLSYLDINENLGNSDEKVSTQKAVKSYIDSAIAGVNQGSGGEGGFSVLFGPLKKSFYENCTAFTGIHISYIAFLDYNRAVYIKDNNLNYIVFTAVNDVVTVSSDNIIAENFKDTYTEIKPVKGGRNFFAVRKTNGNWIFAMLNTSSIPKTLSFTSDEFSSIEDALVINNSIYSVDGVKVYRIDYNLSLGSISASEIVSEIEISGAYRIINPAHNRLSVFCYNNQFSSNIHNLDYNLALQSLQELNCTVDTNVTVFFDANYNYTFLCNSTRHNGNTVLEKRIIVFQYKDNNLEELGWFSTGLNNNIYYIFDNSLLSADEPSYTLVDYQSSSPQDTSLRQFKKRENLWLNL